MNEFETLYELYQKDIYFFLLKLTGYDNDLTEELTQESFYQAFCTFEKFRGECSVRTWLCQVAKNTFYRHLREQSKQRNLTEKLSSPPAEKGISDMVDERIRILHIQAAIQQLDSRSASIVEYRLFGQLSYSEIGRLMNLRESTAKVLFSRAKNKIQTKLKEDYGYEI